MHVVLQVTAPAPSTRLPARVPIRPLLLPAPSSAAATTSASSLPSRRVRSSRSRQNTAGTSSTQKCDLLLCGDSSSIPHSTRLPAPSAVRRSSTAASPPAARTAARARTAPHAIAATTASWPSTITTRSTEAGRFSSATSGATNLPVAAGCDSKRVSEPDRLWFRMLCGSHAPAAAAVPPTASPRRLTSNQTAAHDRPSPRGQHQSGATDSSAAVATTAASAPKRRPNTNHSANSSGVALTAAARPAAAPLAAPAHRSARPAYAIASAAGANTSKSLLWFSNTENRWRPASSAVHNHSQPRRGGPAPAQPSPALRCSQTTIGSNSTKLSANHSGACKPAGSSAYGTNGTAANGG